MFSRTPQHEHAEPAQRALAATALQPDSEELARLLTGDAAPEVRIAAARRCGNITKLTTAWQNESDAAVRAAVAAALGNRLDAAGDAEHRREAIRHVTDESLLVELALAAGHAETRKAAAERVQTPAGLRKLADTAKSRDRGVARLAQQRLDAINAQLEHTTEADAVLAQLAELATKPGPILSTVVDLDRRWSALAIKDDLPRLDRHTAAREAVQTRLVREQDEQRGRTQFERKLRAWMAALAQPDPVDAATLRSELAALREEAQTRDDKQALSELDQAEPRIAQHELELQSIAQAEALVVEAERLAADTTVDNAQLPARWQAIDRKSRTPALTQRFETALIIVEQRRLALIASTAQASNSLRQQVHSLLHAAEQALAAGQLQAARAAADNIKKLKTGAGLLPKPTTQRLGRLVQQLVELERWESFGQQNARVQLCERAEALAAQTLDAPQLAVEVQQLRTEWKALDQLHAGVPKALWERFDGACEKAYAPAARHFAEQAAQRKASRQQRDEFIVAAAAHAPTLLAQSGDAPRDWRAIERWLRETDRKWREGNLGSVEPRAWKKLDTQLKTAVAPLRDALAAARDAAKAVRTGMIEEATALAGKANERDTPSQVKALQARWQEHAKTLSLLQRDERILWDRFRAACDAVFAARQDKRKEEDDVKQQGRRALEEVCAQLEQLGQGTQSEQDIRKAARELADQWRKLRGPHDPALRGVETRFKKAQAAVETLLSGRAREQKAAVWSTLAAKENLCQELDSMLGTGNAAQAVGIPDKWAALPALPDAWEKKMLARRDNVLHALAEPAAAAEYAARIERGTAARRERLLELELSLGLDSPPEFQQQRLALQVKQLRDRFKNETATGANTPAERLFAWCAEPGVTDASDRQRIERAFAKVSRNA